MSRITRSKSKSSGITLEFVDGSVLHIPSLGIIRAWVLMLVLGTLFGPFGFAPSFGWCWLVVLSLRLFVYGYQEARKAWR